MILSNAKIYSNAGAADYYELAGEGLFVGAQAVKGEIPTKEIQFISGINDNQSLIRFDIYLVKGSFVAMDGLEKGDPCGIKYDDGAVVYTVNTVVASKKIIDFNGKKVVFLQLTPSEVVALAPHA